MKLKSNISDKVFQNKTTFSRALSTSSSNSSIQSRNLEINELFNKLLMDSESNHVNFEKDLSICISNNKNKNHIMQQIFDFISRNNLYYLTILKCLNCIINTITENDQILFFLNSSIPLLVSHLFRNSKELKEVDTIINYISELINILKEPIKEIMEKIIDDLYDKYFDVSKIKDKNTNEIAKYIFIILSVEIGKNSPNLISKYIDLSKFKETLKIYRECFKDKNEAIRKAIGDSVKYYIKLIEIKYKGSELYSIKKYYDISYEELILGYSNNIPNNYYLISGFIIFLKNVYEAKPFFFKNPEIYIKSMDELIKCKNCGVNNLNIIIEFIKNIPLLNKLNKKVFKEKYSKIFIDYAISLFNNKTNILLRNQLFICLGKLNFNIDEEIFSLCIPPLMLFINSIFSEQNNIDDEIFKCISDLLNNKDHFYIDTIITNFDIYVILPLLFKTPLSIYKVEFLITIITCYSNFTMENISTVIISLNVISFLFGFDDFKLDYFNKFIENRKKNFVSSKLEDILIITKKNTLKYIYENKKNYRNDSYRYISSANVIYSNSNEISYALTLLSQIKNKLFFKDMLIFYNDKLLPLLNFADNKICKQILEIILSDFIKIYNDDINLSEYIMKNILHSIINILITNKNSNIKIYALEVLYQKKALRDIIIEKHESFFELLIGQLLPAKDKELYEEILKIIKEFSSYDNFRNNFQIFLKNRIYNILNEVMNSNNFYFSNVISDKFIDWVKYFKHLFNEETFNNSMFTSIYLLITYIDAQNIIRINGLLIIDDLLDSDYLKNNKNNDIIKTFCNICYVCCFYLFKKYGNTNSYIANCSTKIIYKLIKYCNFNIYQKLNNHEYINSVMTYNKKYFSYKDKLKIIGFNNNFIRINKEVENVDAFYLLLEYIIKAEKNSSNVVFLNVIKIFGFCGPVSPARYRNLSPNKKSELKFYLDFLNEQCAKKYKNKIEISDITNTTDVSDIKAIISLMQSIIINKQKQLSIKIIDCLEKLIKEIKPIHHNFIDVILKTIIIIIPKYRIIHQKKLFQNILLIEELFPDKVANNLDDTMNLIINFTTKNYFDVVYKIYEKIFQDFYYCIDNYYPILVPKFISIIKSGVKGSTSFIKLLTLMTKNSSIYPYLKVIIKELRTFYLRKNISKQAIQFLYSFLEQILQISNTFLLYQILITNLLDKLKSISFPFLSRNTITNNEYKINQNDVFVTNPNSELNILIVQYTLKLFSIMNNKYKNQFSPFLLDIINTFININIFKFSFCKKELYKILIRDYNHLFIDSINYAKKINSLFNHKNCSLSFAAMKKISKNNNIQNETINISISKSEIVRKKTMNPNMNKKGIIQSIFNRRYQIDKELILKKFNNNYCNLEEDWNDWYKSLCVVLFEQSPAYLLNFCHIFIDFNFQLISELSIYAFYSFYINTNDSDKIAITKYLKNALQNNKTPNFILLTILNAAEYMEKKNINMSLMDYHSFGNIAYKYKAFAKALYYIENDFNIKNDAENFEKLTHLYSVLGIRENAEGLIKMANNNHFMGLKNSNKKYIWYVNIFEYDIALKIIEEQFSEEKNLEEIKNLKKYRSECLNGLCDWEKIIKYIESENENDYNNSNDLKTILGKEYMGMISASNLSKWDKLKEHVNKLNKILANNFDLEDVRLNNDENVYNSDIENKDVKEDIQIHLNNDLYQKMYYLEYKDKLNQKYENEKKTLFADYRSSFDNRKYSTETENNIFLYSEISDHCNFEINEEIIADLNIFAAIVNYNDDNFEISKKYLQNAKSIVLNNIRGLLNESYISCYSNLVKNQLICDMEQFINYKQYHLNDEEYLNQMKLNVRESFRIIEKTPITYRLFISLHSLVFPIEEEYYKYIELANFYRKENNFVPCFKIINTLKKQIKISGISDDKNDNLQLNEMKIKIDLCYNKCLFDKGNINEAVMMAEKLVKLLDDNNELNSFNKISNELKSKIYGNYAIYKKEQSNLTTIKILKIKKEMQIIKKVIRRKSFNILNSKTLELLNLDTENQQTLEQFPINRKKTVKNINSMKIKRLTKNYDKNFLNVSDQFYYKAEEINDINKLLLISTKYNKNSYKNWHNFAMTNYKFYKYLLDNIKNPFFKDAVENYANKQNENNYVIKFAINALNGFKKSLMIVGKNNGKVFQDLMPFINMFFEKRNRSDEILDLINQIFNDVEVEIFLFIIPQLTCRFTVQDSKKLQILINLLNRIGITYPKILMFYLVPIKLSNSLQKQSIVDKILYSISKKNKLIKNIFEKYKLFISELNKCAILLHEAWRETIERAKPIMFNKDINGVIEEIMPLYNKINKKPESMYEINFYQKFENELKEAKRYLIKAENYNNFEYIKEAWEIYQSIYRKIGAEYKNMNSFSLEYVSPKLYNLEKNFYIISCLNTLYYLNNNSNKKEKYKTIAIKKIHNIFHIFNSKQKPRKIIFIMENDKQYNYLLKGKEDLRQDYILVQIFNIINTIIARDRISKNKDLFISLFNVVSLSQKSGLISWINNSDSMNKIILEQRNNSDSIPNIELKTLNNLYPKYESGNFLSKVEIFKEILKETSGTEISRSIWIKSENCESWLDRRTNFSTSLAIMSIAGYIMGLGDRHPENLLMNRENGKIIHIDFGDCFETAMNRLSFPEKVPFRLTRMLVKALGIIGVEGTFRKTCEKIMELLRKNKDLILSILNALIYETNICFRYIIPNIIKLQKQKKSSKKNIEINVNIQINNNILNDFNLNKNNICLSAKDFMPKKRQSIISKKLINDVFLTSKKLECYDNKENHENGSKDEEKQIKNLLNEVKDEKNIMQREEDQILKYYEEKEEIDSEETNKIAQIIINRVIDKLTGMDFNTDYKISTEEQVDRLINQATSNENLAQSYLGWCPFW